MSRSHEEITDFRQEKEKKIKFYYLYVSFLINLAYSDIFPECLEHCCSWATESSHFQVAARQALIGVDACPPKNYY